jgi:hypothetical protein
MSLSTGRARVLIRTCPAVADGTTAVKAVRPIEELRRLAGLYLHEEKGKKEEGD